MGRREDLHNKLVAAFGRYATHAEERVYFQPPPTVRMEYPCIVYSLSNYDIRYADNQNYNSTALYMVTIIDRNPDTDLLHMFAGFPLCSFDRHYTADNLHHYTFRIYY